MRYWGLILSSIGTMSSYELYQGLCMLLSIGISRLGGLNTKAGVC